MARGDKKQVMQASMGVSQKAQDLSATQQQDVQGAEASTGKLESGILPTYQTMAAGKLTSPQQQALGASAGSATEALGRRAARTRNAASTTAGEDQIARQKMMTAGQLAGENQVTGLQGMAGMYGIDEATLRAKLGLPTSSLGVAGGALAPATSVANQPTFWDQLTRAAGQSLGTFGVNVGGG